MNVYCLRDVALRRDIHGVVLWRYIYKATLYSSQRILISGKSTEDGVFSEGHLPRPVRSPFDSRDSCVVCS